jgi:hypothetical protein
MTDGFPATARPPYAVAWAGTVKMRNQSRPQPTEDAYCAVAVLRWPDQEHERRRLAALGRPRVLLAAADVIPPSLLDT